MDYILKAENLTKIYGHHKALDNFSIHIPQGSIYGLVGKNGAGKTTLLRIICGLQEATFGDYSLYGISSRKHEILNARKEMGAVIETPAIYLDMSATGNLKEQYRVLGSHGDRYGGFQSVPTGSGVRTIFGPNVERC